MKKNNRGFTLIELLAVVAIIGIMAGIIGLSASTSHSAKNKRAATELNALISMCRTNCISRAGNVYLELSLNADGEITASYYEGSSLVSTKILGNKKTPMSYTTTSSGAPLDFRADIGSGISFSFDRSSGSQKPQSGSDAYITSIIIGNNTIELVPETGSHRLVGGTS